MKYRILRENKLISMLYLLYPWEILGEKSVVTHRGDLQFRLKHHLQLKIENNVWRGGH